MVGSEDKVLSASIRLIRDLKIANQNLVGKLREAFTMASKEVATYAGSGPYLTIFAATYLIKLTL